MTSCEGIAVTPRRAAGCCTLPVRVTVADVSATWHLHLLGFSRDNHTQQLHCLTLGGLMNGTPAATRTVACLCWSLGVAGLVVSSPSVTRAVAGLGTVQRPTTGLHSGALKEAVERSCRRGAPAVDPLVLPSDPNLHQLAEPMVEPMVQRQGSTLVSLSSSSHCFSRGFPSKWSAGIQPARVRSFGATQFPGHCCLCPRLSHTHVHHTYSCSTTDILRSMRVGNVTWTTLCQLQLQQLRAALP